MKSKHSKVSVWIATDRRSEADDQQLHPEAVHQGPGSQHPHSDRRHLVLCPANRRDPDFLPVVGFLEDLGVIGLALGCVKNELDAYMDWREEIGLEMTEPLTE